MRKSIQLFTISALAFGLMACNKTQDATAAPTADSAVVDAHAGHDHAAEGAANPMLEATKANPVTTVALAESNFAFGTIKKGEVKSHTFEITNTGQAPLIISNVQPGCGCTVPDFTKEPILPGEKGKITLKFDSSSFDGSVSKAADVFANVENAPIRIGFTADIVN